MAKIVNSKFGELFKKYRLRSEFDTLAELADELFTQGLIYDQSVFSRWQKGERIPNERKVLLVLIKLFVQKGGIVSLDEIDEFLHAAGKAGLMYEEQEFVLQNHKLSPSVPFQVPREIANFIGRKEEQSDIEQRLQQKQIVLIHGSAGRGKTSLAIKLGHSLKHQYPDGVLWYRLDISSIKSILGSIALAFGKDITHIQDVQSRSQIIKSILDKKKVLLIFDNVEKDTYIDLLIPNSDNTGVIITSRYKNIKLSTEYKIFSLPTFSTDETLTLFNSVLGEQSTSRQQNIILSLAEKVGFSPLALHILAKKAHDHADNVRDLHYLLNEPHILSEFSYEDKDIRTTLQLAFNDLTAQEKDIFISLGLFEGIDFSVNPLAFIHDIPFYKINEIISKLCDVSLVEYSVNNRFRLHPLVKFFVQEKVFENGTFLQRAAQYYDAFLSHQKDTASQYYMVVREEIDNILGIYNKCYEKKVWESVLLLSQELRYYMLYTELWVDLKDFTEKMLVAAQALNNKKEESLCYIQGIGWYYYWQGNVKEAEQAVQKGLKMAEKNNDLSSQYLAYQQLGQIHYSQKNFPTALSFLNKSLVYFRKQRDLRNIFITTMHKADTYMLMNKLDKSNAVLLECVDLLQVINNKSQQSVELSRVYTRLGIVNLTQKKYDQAKFFFEKSQELDKVTGAVMSIKVWNKVGLGIIHEYYGNVGIAQKYYEIAYEESFTSAIYDTKAENTGVFYSVLTPILKQSELYKPFC